MDILTPKGRFEYCVNIILQHEGGYTNDPNDSGGETNFGITHKDLDTYAKSLNLPENVKDLTQDNAEYFYSKVYWEKYHYNAFNELAAVAKVFDLAVNMGAHEGHSLLQIAINHLSDEPITVDGILGGETFGAANALDGDKLRQALRDCANAEYIEILAAHPHDECFREGWLKRAAW
jgi:lysozyme family protein